MPEVERLPESDFQNPDGDFMFHQGRLLTREEVIGLLEQLRTSREQTLEWEEAEFSLGQSPTGWIADEERELFDLLGIL